MSMLENGSPHALWCVSPIFFTPVAWIIMSSFVARRILATPPTVIFTPTLNNYIELFTQNRISQAVGKLHRNVVECSHAVLVCSLRRSAFRVWLKGTHLMFILLSIRMLPGPAVILPVFLMFANFGWKDQHIPLMLFYAMFSVPFSVWILKGFLDGVSVRFDETGLANGGSWLHVIFQVVLPQVKPGLIAAFIFNLIFVWNEFLFNFVIGGVQTQNIPYALAVGTYSDGGLNWTFIAALTSIYILPPVAFIFLFQKYLLAGMTFGTVRGEV